MKKYTIEELKAEFHKNGYAWFDFHLIGVRSRANIPNKFDDMFALVSGNNIYWYPCTTNPGTYYLLNLMNPKGAAMVKPGQYVNSWKLGLHKGQYPALVQVKPITVYRDADKDAIAEETPTTETGLFGIDIHRANPSFISQLVDKWSAGCTVLNNPADFDAMLSMCKHSQMLTKNEFFSYTILREF